MLAGGIYLYKWHLCERLKSVILESTSVHASGLAAVRTALIDASPRQLVMTIAT
jgi:hypothetical protein